MTRVVLARRWLGAYVLYACLSALVVASSGAPSPAQQTKQGECTASNGCVTEGCRIVSPWPLMYLCYEEYPELYKTCKPNYSLTCTLKLDKLCGIRRIYEGPGVYCDDGSCAGGNFVETQYLDDPDACSK